MLHDKIRRLREIHQWTQEEMAEKASLSKNGYANIERGENIPNFESLEKIATVFGMKVEELISTDESNFVVSIIHGTTRDNYTSYYSNQNHSLQQELEKLEEKIQLQQELLNQKDLTIQTLTNENNLLKEMIQLLKQSHQ